MTELLPATRARPDELEALTHRADRALERRGEPLGRSWVEETAADLKAGRLPGWYHATDDGGSLGFYSLRRDRAFGHVHVSGETDPEGMALRLLETMTASLPTSIRSMDAGFTGLSLEEERSLAERIPTVPGSTLRSRTAMERLLTPSDGTHAPVAPRGVHLAPLRAINVGDLARLDRAAFEGSPDASLIGTEIDDYHRILSELLEGNFGRLLDEASTVLITEKRELVGALISGEQSPHQGIFLDIAVHPAHRRIGLGAYLVRWGARALFALGYGSVRLWVTDANAPARALYEREGFHPVQTGLLYRWARSDPPAVPQPHSVR